MGEILVTIDQLLLAVCYKNYVRSDKPKLIINASWAHHYYRVFMQALFRKAKHTLKLLMPDKKHPAREMEVSPGAASPPPKTCASRNKIQVLHQSLLNFNNIGGISSDHHVCDKLGKMITQSLVRSARLESL